MSSKAFSHMALGTHTCVGPHQDLHICQRRHVHPREGDVAGEDGTSCDCGVGSWQQPGCGLQLCRLCQELVGCLQVRLHACRRGMQ